MQEHFLLMQRSPLFFQATGMELNLSKNGISCGDPGMTCYLLGSVIMFSLRDVFTPLII